MRIPNRKCNSRVLVKEFANVNTAMFLMLRDAKRVEPNSRNKESE